MSEESRTELQKLEHSINTLAECCKVNIKMLELFLGDGLNLFNSHTSQLENCTDLEEQTLCSSMNGGAYMASKFKERVKVGVDSQGRAIYAWACGSTKEELHSSIAAILAGGTAPPQASLWEDYVPHWYETYSKPKLREKTALRAGNTVKNHITPAFAGKHLNEITVSDVQQYLNSKSKYAKAYTRDIMNMLSQVFKAAVDEELISKNPMDSQKIFNPSKKVEVRNALSPAEQADIIANIPNLKEMMDRRFMAFLMFTPLRPSEIFGLRWEDIDFEHGLLHICRSIVFCNGKAILGDTKTEAGKRTIPLDKRLIEHLAPRQENGYVIHRTTKGHETECYTEQTARRAWERIKRTIDVHKMTPYVGRHTFATNMSRAGVPMKTAQAIMGHADERMLARTYIHTDSEDLIKAGKRVSEYVENLQI